MKTRMRFFAWACLALAIPTLALADYRIAYSGDGNQHDADDWHASPFALAMIAESGNKHRLVHFDYNNHIGDNDSWRAQTHHEVVQAAVTRYGYDPSLVYDDQRNLSGAVRSIADEINASSADDRLYLVCAGPMEVCYRGIDAAWDAKERYVTVISHSRWNDTHSDTWQMTHQWDDIRRDFDVEADHIADQNYTAFRSDPEAWAWLKWQNHGDWLYPAIAEGRKAGDASDAGMVFYVLDGRHDTSEAASMDDIRTLFQSGDSDAAPDTDAGTDDGTPVDASPAEGAVQVRKSGKCLDVAKWSEAEGGNVQQWSCTGWANQRWQLENQWGDVFTIRSDHSGRCLNVAKGASWNGANVEQSWCNDRQSQRFRKEAMGDGWFRLRARNSDRCVTVAGASGWNGANIYQWNCHGGWNQYFKVD